MQKKFLVLAGGTIIDVNKSKLLKDQAIIIQDKYIKDIVPVDKIPRNIKQQIFDVKDHYILPGFIDTHTHMQMSGKEPEMRFFNESVPKKAFRAAANARKTLEAGFTTVRDLGAEYLIDLALRDAIHEGLATGPRMFVSGYKIMPTGADFPLYAPEIQISGQHTMDSPAEIKKAVRTLLARGVDLIKVMTSGRTFRPTSSPDAHALTLEDTKLIVEEAHNQNRAVSAHAHGSKGVKIALQAGCDTLEHGTFLDDEDIEMMIKNHVFLVPTLSYGKQIEILGDKCDLPGYAVKKALESRKTRMNSFAKALQNGVKIAMGSDAGMPFCGHGQNAFELIAMVEAGMSLMQSIQSMTCWAAELLDMSEQIGAITPDKFADIVIVDKNPLQDISILGQKQNIKAVLKEGQIVVDRGLKRQDTDPQF